MELFGSAASPFVRKVRIVANEAGLDEGMVWHELTTSPVDPDAGLAESNPLVKMPTMKTEDGQVLYDSRVICEYLDSLGARVQIFPEHPDERWRALCLQALGDGIMDAAVSIRYEQNIRPQKNRWDAWIRGQLGKIRWGLDRAETEALSLDDELHIGVIALACAGGYLDFRFPEEDWRRDRPALANWHERFSLRESMILTNHIVQESN